MNRRTRTITALSIALVLATVASLAVYRAIKRIPVREVEVANYHVVVAAKPLSMGARLTAADLKVVAWPSTSPVANAHKDVSEVLNRGLLSAVVENEPVTESKLAPLEAGAGLPPSIPPGMRAMSVKVNEVVGVAGFVIPGTRVDVLVTLKQRSNESEPISRAVVSNVQVLTAGTRYDQEKAKDGEPIPSTVVTLMVSPADAERITLAQAQGQIMLALRNPLDVAQTDTQGVRTGALLGQPSPAPAKPRAAARPSTPAAPAVVDAPKAYTVEAIRAAKRSEEVVR
jgi:pilus assembly protein CpaB